MAFEKEIIQILKEAGTAGLSIQKITRHVFNAHNSFFEEVPKDKVHKAVCNYLRNNSQKQYGIIEKVSWGVYRLNMNSSKTNELLLQFTDEPVAQPKPVKDQSLNLFD